MHTTPFDALLDLLKSITLRLHCLNNPKWFQDFAKSSGKKAAKLRQDHMVRTWQALSAALKVRMDMMAQPDSLGAAQVLGDVMRTLVPLATAALNNDADTLAKGQPEVEKRINDITDARAAWLGRKRGHSSNGVTATGSGEWSDPMPKAEMANRLKLKPRAFDTFAKSMGIKEAGSRQLWQIRLDGMDALTRQRIENPEAVAKATRSRNK